MNSTSSDKFYAETLDLPDDLEDFTATGLMWKAAQADARVRGISPEDYVSQIQSGIRTFFDKDDLYNREELLATLNETLLSKGTLTLLVGGKNVGKSNVLRSVAEEFNKAEKGPMVVQVDARATGPDIAAGIVQAVKALEPRWHGIFRDLGRRSAGDVGAVLTYATAIPVLGNCIKSLMEYVTHEKAMTAAEAITRFVAVAEKRGRFPCLFVDEANRAFAVRNEKDKARAQDILALLTKLTKEDKKLNVLLASSEHAYPFRLQQNLGFNLSNVGRTVFAGEVPPAAMRELLINHWGMGKGLAEHCLAAYGGHVWHTSMAISRLSLRKEEFAAEDMVPIGLYSGIMKCLKAEAENKGITNLLRELAVHGWAPIDDATDPSAEIFSENNVAGVVSKQSLVVGLPRTVWAKGAKYGLVPASQQVRLMIGEVLSREGAL